MPSLSATLLFLTGVSLSCSVTVDINTESAVRSYDSSHPFTCVTLDWWPSNKCDSHDLSSDCAWINASVLNIDMSSTLIKNALRGMGDVVLRIGGTLGDYITYAVGSDEGIYCPEFSPPPPDPAKYFTGGCLNSTKWDEIMEFCDPAYGCNLVFGINVLRGRECSSIVDSNSPTCFSPFDTCSDTWDGTNADALIQYTASKGYAVTGYELGNEIQCLTAEQYSSSVLDLHASVTAASEAHGLPVPYIIATDSSEYMPRFLQDFLPAVEDVLTAYTWHFYPLNSGAECTGPSNADENNTSVDSIIMDPDGMKLLFKLAEMLETVVDTAVPIDTPEIWMGETGGAFSSGCNGSTNAFMSGFWYLPSMAGLARRGHDMFCRQTLMGGNYELLDKTTYLPNPDYYSSVLYARLMGSILLNSSVSGDDMLRVYSHCSAPSSGVDAGGVTLLFLNYANKDTTVDKVLFHDKGLDGENVSARMEYVFTGVASSDPTIDILHNNQIALNGVFLQPDEDGNMPTMSPVLRKSNTPLNLPAYSYGFIVYPDAQATACM